MYIKKNICIGLRWGKDVIKKQKYATTKEKMWFQSHGCEWVISYKRHHSKQINDKEI